MGTIKQTRHTIVRLRTNRATPLAAIAGCLSVLLLPGCSHHKQQPPVTNAAYQQALADAKKLGIVVSAKDMAQPMPPASQNAAPIYVKLTAVLDARPMSETDTAAELQSRPLDRVHTPEQLAAAVSLLKRRSDVLTVAHQAASRPKCVFTRNWAAPDPANIPFPELGKIRECARFLATESLLMAYRGHGVEAVRNEALSFRLAQHAGSDQTLIAFLVREAITAITARTLQKILVISHGDLRVAQATRQAIDQNWQPPMLSAALQHDVSMWLSEIEFLRQSRNNSRVTSVFGISIPEEATEDDKQWWDETMNANGVYLLSETRKMIHAADLPYPQALSAETTISQEIDRDLPPKRKIPLPWTIRQDLNHMVAHLSLSDASTFVSKQATVSALIRVTRTAAALFEYKAAHGLYPQSLSDLAATMPIDPFDLKPLRYRREGKGFVVYSVGPTLHYDGNVSDKKVVAREAVFKYP